jgi:hypothetical protein
MAARPRWLRRYLGLFEDTVMPKSSAIFFPLGVLLWVLAIGGWVWERPSPARFVAAALAIPAGVAFGVWSLSIERRAVRSKRETGRTFRDLPRGQRILVVTLAVLIVLVFGYLGLQSEWTKVQPP